MQQITPIKTEEFTDDAMSANQVTGLLSKSSPYRQFYETQGRQLAAARGLDNSLMAESMGLAKATEAVAPFALQDAKVNAEKGLLSQTYNQDLSKLGYQGDISSTLQKEQGGITSDLEKQKGAQALTLQKEQGGITSDLEKLKGSQALTLQKEQDSGAMARERLAQEANTTRTQIELSAQQKIKTMDLAQADQADLQASLKTYGDTYQRAINEIMQNKDMTEAAREIALVRVERDYRRNVELAASLAQIPLTWILRKY